MEFIIPNVLDINTRNTSLFFSHISLHDSKIKNIKIETTGKISQINSENPNIRNGLNIIFLFNLYLISIIIYINKPSLWYYSYFIYIQ